jgi:putative transposase
MRKARWLGDWQNSASKAVIYHCISRVVDRRFVLEEREREAFRMFMRMYENFSGCRVLSYCVMSNHFHLMLEVPPMEVGGLTDEALLKRLSALYSEAFVASVAAELTEARKLDAAETGSATVSSSVARVAEVHARFTYRMHDLSEFMKGLLIRFTRWFNRTHSRTGTLWEERFKSVMVESGTATRTVAAYIDLNPVRAGMVADPADYRWSSYGEAVGGGKRGNGRKAREGLVRACFSDQESISEIDRWKETARIYRRLMGFALERNAGRAAISTSQSAAVCGRAQMMNTAEMLESAENGTVLPDLGLAQMLRCRVRYFTDGAVIGSREFVNDAFTRGRERFGSQRKDGARKLRGAAAAANPVLWSLRDLRKGVM